jgi:hypothetical protein
MEATSVSSPGCSPGWGSDGVDASLKSCSGWRSIPRNIPGFVGSSTFVLKDPVMNIAITMVQGASMLANNLRGEK